MAVAPQKYQIPVMELGKSLAELFSSKKNDEVSDFNLNTTGVFISMMRMIFIFGFAKKYLL